MHREDKMLLASQYGRRRVKEGMSPVQASRVAAEVYGLSVGYEKTLRVKLETEAAEAAA